VFIYNQPKMNAMAIALPAVAADTPLIVTSVVAFNVPVTVAPEVVTSILVVPAA